MDGHRYDVVREDFFYVPDVFELLDIGLRSGF